MIPLHSDASPFVGLQSYTEQDARFFFGRDDEEEIIIANLYGERLTVLYGPGGVGKSSVVDAGVVYRLRQKQRRVVVVVRSWHADPLPILKAALVDVCQPLQEQPLDATVPLYQLVRDCGQGLVDPIMIIFDQFEDYLLYHAADHVDTLFQDELARTVNNSDCPANILIVIREESLAKLDRFEARIPSILENYLRLEPLTSEQAELAIRGPIAVYNQDRLQEQQVTIETELIDDLLMQVRVGQGPVGPMDVGEQAQSARAATHIEAAYFQLVLLRLWQTDIRPDARVLRRSTLVALGGAERIVQTHLDQVLDRLPPRLQAVAAQIFFFLVTPSGSKIAHTEDDLAVMTSLPVKDVQSVLDALAQPTIRVMRVVSSSKAMGVVSRYEIYDDVLAPSVLSWCTRYLGSPRLSRFVVLLTFSIVGGLVLQSPDALPTWLKLVTRGYIYIAVHSLAAVQIYRWFVRSLTHARQSRSVAVADDWRLGLGFGLLIALFWYVGTRWQKHVDPYLPFGTITSPQFLRYLGTVMGTVLASMLLFVTMRVVGQFTYSVKKRYDLGYYGVYIGVCIIVGVLIVLEIARILGPVLRLF